MSKILVVDDDSHIRDVVNFALEQAGYQVQQASDGRAAVIAAQRNKLDLIVLDIMMPEMDGTEVCRQIRKNSSIPIVFLSARDDEIDRILGLELGGDDYMTKPFSPRELVARVKAVLRRTQGGGQENDGLKTMEHGRLRLDLEEYRAFWEEQELVLTVTEFGIIRALLRRPGKVLTRDNLMDTAYDLQKIVSGRTIDSHIRRVRSKFAEIGAEPVETVHGIGYKLGAC
jgi:two-component system, OmpR family, response regulator